ncbi:MAG: NADH-quinone oxidoreductase subunit L [Candidatus Omnitrophota bacterium]
MVKFAHFIPLFPVTAFLINLFFGRRLKKWGALVSIVASGASFVLSTVTFAGLLNGEGSYTLGRWLVFGNSTLTVGVTIDPLTCMMLLVVTSIGTLIQIYSVGYMSDDPRFTRFFAYLSLFMGSMTSLLLADNFVMLYIFWEGVGLCSYLLISFWFEKVSAAKAGMKAFLTTRIGDTGLLLGILLLFGATKDLSFAGLAHVSGNPALYTAAAILIFCGAVGKSAQFPLHVWLPDAMEGPTPVSALIHAATMVAAGVYLVGRCFALFVLYPGALVWVSAIGAITALMAASIATVNNDIKRILAYSTVSQLGLMMVGLGVGGFGAGTFHLMTHAFFKALLFLCAGSVIHGVHTQDIRQMGGVFDKMKVTGTAFVIGSLAIAGVPPLAGFWSKDEILTEVWHSGHPFLFAIVCLVSFLTAFYMFRLIFLVLFGQKRSQYHAHESPKTMTVPLMLLSICAIVAGLPGSPVMNNLFARFIHSGSGHAPAELPGYDLLIMGASTVIACSGIALAYLFYMRNFKILPENLRAKLAPVRQLIENKYYFDELYGFLFIRPCQRLGQRLYGFDARIVDGAVNGAGTVTLVLSKTKAWIDRHLVDGLVNLTARTVGASSRVLRKLQTGFAQTHLLIALLGLLLIGLIQWIGG